MAYDDQRPLQLRIGDKERHEVVVVCDGFGLRPQTGRQIRQQGEDGPSQ